jgi:hypothetical protein
MRKGLQISAVVLLMVMALPLAFFWIYGKVNPAPDQAVFAQLEQLRQTHVVANENDTLTIVDQQTFVGGLRSVYLSAPTDRILLAIFGLYFQNDQLKRDPIMQEIACHINEQYSQDRLFLFANRLEEILGIAITNLSIDQSIPQCQKGESA